MWSRLCACLIVLAVTLLVAPPPASAPAKPAAALAPLCDGIEALIASEKTCLKPKDTFRDCPDCPEMVMVPAGTFSMGSTEDENEKRSHNVTITKAFAVGKFEVTFAEWDACVVAGGCEEKPSDEGWGRDRRPVINVSWDDITKEYLPWLSKKTGRTYRLLSEAEWEYAARAGTTTKYSWGNSIDCGKANYRGEQGSSCYNAIGSLRGTQPVGTYGGNPFDLYDMHGNVWEWVEDRWHDSYKGAPTDGSAWTEGGATNGRVLRGGSWYDSQVSLRAAARGYALLFFRTRYVGCRLARTLNP